MQQLMLPQAYHMLIRCLLLLLDLVVVLEVELWSCRPWCRGWCGSW